MLSELKALRKEISVFFFGEIFRQLADDQKVFALWKKINFLNPYHLIKNRRPV
jgi:hypothetical protein